MNPFVLTLILGIVALFQSTLAPILAPFNAKPDLMLVAVISWSLLRGAREGTTWAFVGGIWLDLFSSGPFGLSALALMCVSLTVAVSELTVFRSHIILPVVAILAGTIMHGAAYLLALQVLGYEVVWLDVARRILLPTVFVNVLLTPLLFPVWNLLHRLTGREEMTW